MFCVMPLSRRHNIFSFKLKNERREKNVFLRWSKQSQEKIKFRVF